MEFTIVSNTKKQKKKILKKDKSPTQNASTTYWARALCPYAPSINNVRPPPSRGSPRAPNQK